MYPPGCKFLQGGQPFHADGGGRHLGAPKSFGDVLHTAHRDTGKVHLNERFFYAALPAAIPLNDGCLKGNTLKAWYMECDVSRSGGEVPVVVAAAG